MYKELYKYFVLNKKISFPGIGNFSVEDIPSSIDEIAHIIRPAQQIVHFSVNGENDFNQSLFSFLAKENNQTEAESENKFNIFIVQLKNYLQSNDVVLPLLGTLKKYSNDAGFTFIPHQKSLKRLFPLIGLSTELNVEEESEEHIPGSEEEINKTSFLPQIAEAIVSDEKTLHAAKKDYWWVYAIILTLAAAGGLLYYYFYYTK